MRILLIGAAGRMGGCVANFISNGKHHTLAATVDKQDVAFGCPHYCNIEDVREDVHAILDFSNHILTEPILKFALNKNIPVVIATTGQSEAELSAIYDASKRIPVFLSANMSFGVALFSSVVESVSRAFPYAEVEIVETHHSAKSDAPSGTALMLARAVQKGREEQSPIVFGRAGGRKSRGEIGISSLRLGVVVGKHEVVFDTGFQTITLCHEARSRDLFAIGAINALSFIDGKPAGLYSTKDILMKAPHSDMHT